ncbi:MAG TPA: chemotaxis response regulator protein-glutamate methylesterase, partial [Gemmatimonadales bacterium]|nr:chemotaxis response regulator protein-glutamate methylesterase [Gemmatimonadales bacterium]
AASDPVFAMEKMGKARPDVIVLDLEMPRMDGITFLRKVMAEDPIPVVVCSGIAAQGTEAAIRALEAGAVEVVAKPELGVRDFLHDAAVELVETIRAAAAARVERREKVPPVERPVSALLTAAPSPGGKGASDRVVAIGASTGGTDALRRILEELPLDAPPVVIAQHMPARFTGAFARRLDGICRIRVKEAASGDLLRAGTALIAPGDRHLLVRRHGEGWSVLVDDGPRVSRHRPSVDVLFGSVARTVGARGMGVLLTGMGDDGASGLLEMRRAGAATICQDEATSVVWGMPKVAIDLGAAESVLPLDRIAGGILARARRATPGV